MLTLLCVLAAALPGAAEQTPRRDGGTAVERQHVLSITAADIDGAMLSEITWDAGALLLQGVVANPDGSLSGRYVVIPANGTTMAKLKEQSTTSLDYWDRKSRR